MTRWVLPLLLAGCLSDEAGADQEDLGAAQDSSPEADAAVLDGALPDAAPVDAAEVQDAVPDVEVAVDAAPPVGRPRCPEVAVGPVPAELGLDPFYTRYADARGLPIIARDGVPDAAFRAAFYTLERLFTERPCAREAMSQAGIRFGIMGPGDVTTDFPEYSDFYEAFPGTDWDQRGRGFGATIVRPLTTGASENLLAQQPDPWFGEQIFLHEVAHSFFEFGVEGLEGGEAYRRLLRAHFDAARAEGLWANTYADTNPNEYWAEGVQSWTDSNLQSEPPNGVHNHVDTRAELETHDPRLAELIAELLDPEPWDAWCDPDGAGPAWEPPPVPDAECVLRWAEAEAVSCDEGSRSVSSEAPIELVMVNRTLGPVQVSWQDFEGASQPLGVIAPRSLMTVQTFETHPWRFTDDEGNCLGHFSAPARDARIILGR